MRDGEGSRLAFSAVGARGGSRKSIALKLLPVVQGRLSLTVSCGMFESAGICTADHRTIQASLIGILSHGDDSFIPLSVGRL